MQRLYSKISAKGGYEYEFQLCQWGFIAHFFVILQEYVKLNEFRALSLDVIYLAFGETQKLILTLNAHY